MNKILVLILPVFGMMLTIVSCNNPQPIRLATYTYSTNDRIENLQPLAQVLEERLGRAVEVKSYPDVASFLEGLTSNEVDIGLINTLGYLLLSQNNGRMIPVATLKVRDDAIDNYKTALLTNNMSIRDVDKLKENAKDLSMLFVSEGSTSGNLVPRLMLSALGLNSPEEQFDKVSYGGNHTSTFNQLVDGKTDLCAIGSNEYFQQIQRDSSLLETTQLLWLSDEIPLGPLLLNKGISQSERELITQTILNLHEENAIALESIKAGWSEAKQSDKFYSITDSYYNNFRVINGNPTDLAEILNLFNRN